MEIEEKYDVMSGGFRLTAGRGRRKIKATLWYSLRLDRYVLSGDVNRTYYFRGKCLAAFKAYASDPANVDPGKPLTISEVCMPIPPGLDPAELFEAPPCRSRRQRFRALAWHREKTKKSRHA